MAPRIFAVLPLLFATTAFAESADLALSLSAARTFNGGELATVTATVTNLGPDAATAAGVRLKKVSTRFAGAERFVGCIEMPDSVLCNVPTLAPGTSHEFTVPFFPPAEPGPITLTARTESFTADPNHDNDSATSDATAVDLVDLVTTIDTFPSLQPGKESSIGVVVREQAARKATGVRLSVTIPAPLEVLESSDNCRRAEGDAGSYTCAIQDLDLVQDVARVFFRVLTPAGSPGQLTVSASAASSIDDWNIADNHVTAADPVFALPDLTFTLVAPEALDDNNRGTVKLIFANPTDIAAPSTTADISQLVTGTIVSWNAPGWSCHQTAPFFMWCSIPSLQARSTSTIAVEIQYPAHELRTSMAVTTEQTPPILNFKSIPQTFNPAVVYYRTFEVTSTADSGAGSLRQAIADSNGQCSADDNAPPCRIAFRIPSPVPRDGWFTIEPQSPLPLITSTDFALDGETQTALTGDTNPLGPEVDLLGGAAGDTDGIRLLTRIAEVRGLAIGGFAQNGILSLSIQIPPLPNQSRQTIERNYIGVDPTGRVAVPNGLRGIQAYRFVGTIANNVISGNRRSGAFLVKCDDTVVTGNRVGVAAASDDPLPNGAAGIFFLDTDPDPFHEVRVQGNVIAFNGEDGLSTSQTTRISLLDNVIAHNRTQIDMGLDGPTPDYQNGDVAPQPVITSARYDVGAGETIVEGIVPLRSQSGFYAQRAIVYLYANASDAEGGEQFIGTALADGTGHFALRVHRDLRSRYIDGTTFLTADLGEFSIRLSSEFGRPVPVTE